MELTGDSKRLVEDLQKRGYVRLYDVFNKNYEAVALFGKIPDVLLGEWTWKIPDGESKQIWFPTFFKQGNWEQFLIDGGRIIIRRKLDGKPPAKNDQIVKGMVHVVFGRSRERGSFEYVGEFKLVAGGNCGDLQVLKRIATRTDLPSSKVDE